MEFIALNLVFVYAQSMVNQSEDIISINEIGGLSSG